MQATDNLRQTQRGEQARLRARGLRPVVIWVPDTQRPEFAEEIRRQLALVEASAQDRETLDFIEAAADWSD